VARALRIEYAGAWYFVENTARIDAGPLFKDKADRAHFLSLLTETHQRFKLEIHAYAISQGRFQLLVRTPEANLGRAMRHLCGVFTQGYNRRHKLDGTLFRGRYKTILVEDKHYPLAVASYLNRRKGPEILDSSRKAYLEKVKRPEFLQRDEIRSVIPKGKLTSAACYDAHLKQESFHQLDSILSGNYRPTCIGSETFKQQLSDQLKRNDDECKERPESLEKPCANTVVEHLSSALNVPKHLLLRPQKGPRANNTERHMAMLLCQQCSSLPLKEIAQHFGLSHYASASNRIAKFKRSLSLEPALAEQVNQYRLNIEQEFKQQDREFGGKA